MNYDTTTDEQSDITFKKNFGPSNYAFNYGNVHFIIYWTYSPPPTLVTEATGADFAPIG